MSDGLDALLARIDEAVRLHDPEAITQQVKAALQHAIHERTVKLPERFFRVRADGYARRLLHRNDDLGYTALIPPFEYHVLANAIDRPSVTLHVYGGEMTRCHVFEPSGPGRYARREHLLSYHE